ncbi:Heat shock protein 70 [Cellulomonas flavigena DSM 20109]|uniref:Heat shock protein 70 n=1 Tax=Cellulomonas flavigena (strain ATCC 482 / DSM 20109 / BCRC 11376 / JCM 18109 / NBRC 3775 / NCIMB 8073 / NRS 134) TaxID=446466 RepID=D5UC13_CELFN|nr:Hsp70 family protein [Cellulomonas flavigena]ADG76172.1 Heat shock protein 70 [Cellulomonas flavigena DSM 20109]
MTYGIDFGTSNCAVARWQPDGSYVVPFDSANVSADWYGFGGEQVFPSVFGTSETTGEAMFGWRAKLLADERADAIKRLLNGHHYVTVGSRRYTSGHVATLMFRAIREGMRRAGAELDEAVVTVPAKATGQARFRTREAAHLAGIRTLSLINEPTAAAMAYVDLIRENGRFLVYDWGGGTVDATVLDYEDGVLIERAASGRTELGGVDIDAALRQAVRSRFKNHPSWTAHHARQFRLEVERAKIQLSTEEVVTILSPAGDEVVDLERTEFEHLVKDLVDGSMEPVIEVLSDLRLDPDTVDAVIMVGGSSRMPIARRTLTELLGQEPVAQELLDPMTAVGMGAAFAAAALRQDVDDTICVVTANALGTKVRDEHGASFSTIIPRNSPLPISDGRTYVPRRPLVSEVDVEVWEGDPDRALSDPFNQMLKKLRIPYPRPTPQADARFRLDFTYGEDGRVSVRAEIVKTGVVLFDDVIDVFEENEKQSDRAKEKEAIRAELEAVFGAVAASSAPTSTPPPTPAETSPVSSRRVPTRPVPRPPTYSPPSDVAPVVLVVDGSNVAWSGRDRAAGEKPSIAALSDALDALLATFPSAEIKVVVDANLRHQVEQSEKPLVENAVQSGRWLQPPAGTIGAGDALVLAIAEITEGRVVSNDSYREFQDAHPWLRSGHRMLGATLVGTHWIFLDRKPPAGTSAAQVVTKPAGAVAHALPAGWQDSGWKSQEALAGPRRRATEAFGPVSENYYMSPLDSK